MVSFDTLEPPAPLAVLLENHRAFLAYLERRVGDRALAEDILQDAFAKVLDRPEIAPADEGVVPWFYRTLRNAAIDHLRRRGAADRALESFALRALSRPKARLAFDEGLAEEARDLLPAQRPRRLECGRGQRHQVERRGRRRAPGERRDCREPRNESARDGGVGLIWSSLGLGCHEG